MTIAKRIDEQRVMLTSAAKMLAKKRKDKKKSSRNRFLHHKFHVWDPVLLKEHNKGKFEFRRESGYRIIEFSNYGTARVRHKDYVEPKHCSVKDLKLRILVMLPIL